MKRAYMALRSQGEGKGPRAGAVLWVGAALYLLFVIVGVCWLYGGARGGLWGHRTAIGRTSSIAAIEAHLAGGPPAWSGRIVWVRAIAEPCPVWGSPHDALHCRSPRPQLIDANQPDLVDPLPLVTETRDPVLRVLRHLPLLERLFPPPTLAWESVRAYELRLRYGSGEGCDIDRCLEAEVLAVRP